MAALHAEGLPVPAVVASSDDAVVDGRPFVLMEMVHGDRVEPAIAAGSNPLRLASSAVEVLRRLQAVPAAKTSVWISRASKPRRSTISAFSAAARMAAPTRVRSTNRTIPAATPRQIASTRIRYAE